jgi:hypothetical protein
MGRVLSSNTTLAVAIEETLGVLPTTPVWKTQEPNSIGAYGATTTQVARTPISKNRQRRKGVTTDLDSAMDFDTDLTASAFDDFVEGFLFAAFTGEVDRDPSEVTGTAYTVDTGTVIPVQALVRGVNFGVQANNGLHLVDGVPTATSITATGLSAEATPPAAAHVEIVGLEGEAGDITVTNSGGVITIGSTLLDFTDFGLRPGQNIFIGGTATLNRFFASPSLNNTGMARVVSVAATAIVIDKTSETFVTDTGAAKQIQIFFGRFVKNLPTNDASFLVRSFQFEMGFPGLADNGVDSAYGYSKGNLSDSMAVSLPLTDKAGISFGFIGTDTTTPSETRADEAENAIDPIRTDSFSTSTDCIRLRIQNVDETGLTTDFKSATITFNNGISPEKVLCTLGAAYMNYGMFEVNIETQALFTDPDVIAAIRNNTTVSMDFGVKNDNGVIMFDIPSMTLGDGSLDIPENESVLINVTSEAFQDPILNSSIGVSILPYVPTL